MRLAAATRAFDPAALRARWLLMCHERVGEDVFPTTHEFIGQMLGAPGPQSAKS
ncbi:MAG TPA: hypothetical protein VFK25_10070 [Candidatus Binatia bacterium]|nr:hypothetical protein [Candidatus Binatia bacterium]